MFLLADNSSTVNTVSSFNSHLKPLKILYTNCDQFPNKLDDLLMSITVNEPDIILLNEVIPKAQIMPLSLSLIAISNYSIYKNFDPNTYFF